jgi:hypothetical protein
MWAQPRRRRHTPGSPARLLLLANSCRVAPGRPDSSTGTSRSPRAGSQNPIRQPYRECGRASIVGELRADFAKEGKTKLTRRGTASGGVCRWTPRRQVTRHVEDLEQPPGRELRRATRGLRHDAGPALAFRAGAGWRSSISELAGLLPHVRAARSYCRALPPRAPPGRRSQDAFSNSLSWFEPEHRAIVVERLLPFARKYRYEALQDFLETRRHMALNQPQGEQAAGTSQA